MQRDFPPHPDERLAFAERAVWMDMRYRSVVWGCQLLAVSIGVLSLARDIPRPRVPKHTTSECGAPAPRSGDSSAYVYVCIVLYFIVLYCIVL